jgi:hypothetical protein
MLLSSVFIVNHPLCNENIRVGTIGRTGWRQSTLPPAEIPITIRLDVLNETDLYMQDY